MGHSGFDLIEFGGTWPLCIPPYQCDRHLEPRLAGLFYYRDGVLLAPSLLEHPLVAGAPAGLGRCLYFTAGAGLSRRKSCWNRYSFSFLYASCLKNTTNDQAHGLLQYERAADVKDIERGIGAAGELFRRVSSLPR
jgi:hypothetical protein